MSVKNVRVRWTSSEDMAISYLKKANVVSYGYLHYIIYAFHSTLLRLFKWYLSFCQQTKQRINSHSIISSTLHASMASTHLDSLTSSLPLAYKRIDIWWWRFSRPWVPIYWQGIKRKGQWQRAINRHTVFSLNSQLLWVCAMRRKILLSCEKCSCRMIM